MAHYRKKPIVIEAVQSTEDEELLMSLKESFLSGKLVIPKGHLLRLFRLFPSLKECLAQLGFQMPKGDMDLLLEIDGIELTRAYLQQTNERAIEE